MNLSIDLNELDSDLVSVGIDEQHRLTFMVLGKHLNAKLLDFIPLLERVRELEDAFEQDRHSGYMKGF